MTESVPKTEKSDRTPFAALLLRHPDECFRLFFSVFVRVFLGLEGGQKSLVFGVVLLGFYAKHQGKEDQGRTLSRFTTRPLPVHFTTKMSVVRPFPVLSKDDIGP